MENKRTLRKSINVVEEIVNQTQWNDSAMGQRSEFNRFVRDKEGSRTFLKVRSAMKN